MCPWKYESNVSSNCFVSTIFQARVSSPVFCSEILATWFIKDNRPNHSEADGEEGFLYTPIHLPP